MHTVTREQVVDTLGRLDDLKIAEIIATGATPAEVVEAKRWLAGDKRTLGDEEPLRPSVIGAVCDLLRADEPDWDEK